MMAFLEAGRVFTDLKKIHPPTRESKPEGNLFRDFLRLADGSVRNHELELIGQLLFNNEVSVFSVDGNDKARVGVELPVFCS